MLIYNNESKHVFIKNSLEFTIYSRIIKKIYLIFVLEDFPQLSFKNDLLRCHCMHLVYGLHSAIYCVP